MDDPVDKEEAVFKRLKGEKKHYCPDWDYMAIDETCIEFECCTCENLDRANTPDKLA